MELGILPSHPTSPLYHTRYQNFNGCLSTSTCPGERPLATSTRRRPSGWRPAKRRFSSCFSGHPSWLLAPASPSRQCDAVHHIQDLADSPSFQREHLRVPIRRESPGVSSNRPLCGSNLTATRLLVRCPFQQSVDTLVRLSPSAASPCSPHFCRSSSAAWAKTCSRTALQN